MTCLNTIRILLFLCIMVGSTVLQAALQIHLPQNPVFTQKLSIGQLQEAAEAGDPDAQYALGYAYYYGQHVKQNTQTGQNWIKRAAVQDQPQAVEAMHVFSPSQKIYSPTTQLSLSSTPHAAAAKTDLKISTIQRTEKIPKRYYTIQLLATANQKNLLHYIQTNTLQRKTHVYHNKNNLYILLYGVYATWTQAHVSLLKLPDKIKKGHPWIKSIAQVKSSLH